MQAAEDASIYSLRQQALPQRAGTIRARVFVRERAMTFAEVIDAWRNNPAFQTAWTTALTELPLTACFWELPPLDSEALREPFECVFVDAPALVPITDDPRAFAEYFAANTDRAAIAFRNLSGDAMLMAPTPSSVDTAYEHLLSFLRSARPEQAAAFWNCVAETLDKLIDARKPLWLSTAGLGVDWLHVRLDSWPKYYRHRPYTSPDFWGRRR